MADSTDSGRAEGRLSLLINSTYGGILYRLKSSIVRIPFLT